MKGIRVRVGRPVHVERPIMYMLEPPRTEKKPEEPRRPDKRDGYDRLRAHLEKLFGCQV